MSEISPDLLLCNGCWAPCSGECVKTVCDHLFCRPCAEANIKVAAPLCPMCERGLAAEGSMIFMSVDRSHDSAVKVFAYAIAAPKQAQQLLAEAVSFARKQTALYGTREAWVRAMEAEGAGKELDAERRKTQTLEQEMAKLAASNRELQGSVETLAAKLQDALRHRDRMAVMASSVMGLASGGGAGGPLHLQGMPVGGGGGGGLPHPGLSGGGTGGMLHATPSRGPAGPESAFAGQRSGPHAMPAYEATPAGMARGRQGAVPSQTTPAGYGGTRAPGQPLAGGGGGGRAGGGPAPGPGAAAPFMGTVPPRNITTSQAIAGAGSGAGGMYRTPAGAQLRMAGGAGSQRPGSQGEGYTVGGSTGPVMERPRSGSVSSYAESSVSGKGSGYDPRAPASVSSSGSTVGGSR